MSENPSHIELLSQARQIDERLDKERAEKSGKPVEPAKPVLYVKPHLFSDQTDEFGGNENNRRVAERRAEQRKALQGDPKPPEKPPVPVVEPPQAPDDPEQPKAPVDLPAATEPAPVAPVQAGKPAAAPVWKRNA